VYFSLINFFEVLNIRNSCLETRFAPRTRFDHHRGVLPENPISHFQRHWIHRCFILRTSKTRFSSSVHRCVHCDTYLIKSKSHLKIASIKTTLIHSFNAIANTITPHSIFHRQPSERAQESSTSLPSRCSLLFNAFTMPDFSPKWKIK